MVPSALLRMHTVTYRTLVRAPWRVPPRPPAVQRLSVRSDYTAKGRYAALGAGHSTPHNSKAVTARQHIVSEVPFDMYKAVGVSFEGRQELVSQLQQGQAVAFVKEPTNEYDPNAVAVQTLDGRTLGYIPRDETQRFLQDSCFGQVISVGQAEEGQGMFGFRVLVQPSMPPVQVLAFPSMLTPYSSIASMLSGDAWESVKARTLERARNRCELTGASQPQPECREQWVFDDALHVVRLAGFQALAPEVHQVQHLLALPPDSQQEAMQLLSALNGWGREEDAQVYLNHMREVQQRRSQQPSWRLDLRLLQQLGIPIPNTIAPMRMVH